MFILRRITGKGLETNKVLGESYAYFNRFTNPDEFKSLFKNQFKKDHVADLDPKSDDDTKRVYAFISYNGKIQPLWCNQLNFIMTGEGKTFANVSFR